MSAGRTSLTGEGSGRSRRTLQIVHCAEMGKEGAGGSAGTLRPRASLRIGRAETEEVTGPRGGDHAPGTRATEGKGTHSPRRISLQLQRKNAYRDVHTCHLKFLNSIN